MFNGYERVNHIFIVIFTCVLTHQVAIAQLANPDFDGDGQLDCYDVDTLTMAIVDNSTSPHFDLNGDGVVSRLDVHEWLVVAGNRNPFVGAPYLLGDAELDGSVTYSDTNGVWDGNQFSSNRGRWCSGDLNADGWVDVSDRLIMYVNMFQDSGDVPGIGEGVELIPSDEGRFVYDPTNGNMFVDFKSRIDAFVIRGADYNEFHYAGFSDQPFRFWNSQNFHGGQFWSNLGGLEGIHLIASYDTGLDADHFEEVEYGADRLRNDLPGILSTGVDLARVLAGDANLDGVVDVSDFNIWNRHRFTDDANWGTGDWNGDGTVDVSDFNIWNANKFTGNPNMVPEPSAFCIGFVSLWFLLRVSGIRFRTQR